MHCKIIKTFAIKDQTEKEPSRAAPSCPAVTSKGLQECRRGHRSERQRTLRSSRVGGLRRASALWPLAPLLAGLELGTRNSEQREWVFALHLKKKMHLPFFCCLFFFRCFFCALRAPSPREKVKKIGVGGKSDLSIFFTF